MESLLELLQVQNANLRQTADALRKPGPLRDELLRQINSSERGEVPDKRFAALSAESMDLLEEIRYMLLPPVDCVAESFFGKFILISFSCPLPSLFFCFFFCPFLVLASFPFFSFI
jgi:hypothetical protein